MDSLLGYIWVFLSASGHDIIHTTLLFDFLCPFSIISLTAFVVDFCVILYSYVVSYVGNLQQPEVEKQEMRF